jgi:hypothetical protein
MDCLLIWVLFKPFQISISRAPVILVYVQVGGRFEHSRFYVKYELASVGDLVSQAK